MPKISPSNLATFERNFFKSFFKNYPIWSHWSPSTLAWAKHNFGRIWARKKYLNFLPLFPSFYLFMSQCWPIFTSQTVYLFTCLMQLPVYPHFYIPVINTNHLSVYLCRSPICVLSFKPFSQFSLNHPLSLCLFFLFIRVSIFWVKDIPRKATPKTTQRISFQKAKNRKFTFQWRWKRSFLWKYLQIFHQVFPLTAFLRKRFNKNVTSVAN